MNRVASSHGDTGAGAASVADRPTVVVVVQGPHELALATAPPLAARLRERFPSASPRVLATAWRAGEMVLVPSDGLEAGQSGELRRLESSASQGAVPGAQSPLGPLLREGRASGARALAVVAAEPHDPEVDWLQRLLSPVIDGDADFVCPAYRRHRTDGAINTGIVAPLVRALYGVPLHQPLGTEVALSATLANRLLDDDDWRRRPAEAGSDAWLVAKTLGDGSRVAQAWLGAWPRPAAPPEAPSETLARALGLVFTEMERSAARWQRSGPARPAAELGGGGYEPGGEPLDPARLLEAFARGLRDLGPLWSLVLPPETMLALRRHADRPPGDAWLPEGVWARVIYDFGVAHMTRVVERRQLLRSLAPLYLGWLAGLAHAAAALDEAGFAARVEALAAGFEREKRYLVARWRWPDEFNP